MLIRTQTQAFIGQRLEGAQQFGAAIEHGSAVRAGELNQDFGYVFESGIQLRIYSDAVLELEGSGGEQSFEQVVDPVGGGNFISDGHANRFYYAGEVSCPSEIDQ